MNPEMEPGYGEKTPEANIAPEQVAPTEIEAPSWTIDTLPQLFGLSQTPEMAATPDAEAYLGLAVAQVERMTDEAFRLGNIGLGLVQAAMLHNGGRTEEAFTFIDTAIMLAENMGRDDLRAAIIDVARQMEDSIKGPYEAETGDETGF